MAFNIKSQAIAPTADMAVRDVSGEPQFDDAGNALSITFCSPGTKQYQKAKHKTEERNNSRVFSKMQGKSDGKLSADDKLAERADFLADCTISFNNFGVDGLSGHELFKAVYSDIEIGHIADDADKFLGERVNFKKPSVKS